MQFALQAALGWVLLLIDFFFFFLIAFITGKLYWQISRAGCE